MRATDVITSAVAAAHPGTPAEAAAELVVRHACREPWAVDDADGVVQVRGALVAAPVGGARCTRTR